MLNSFRSSVIRSWFTVSSCRRPFIGLSFSAQTKATVFVSSVVTRRVVATFNWQKLLTIPVAANSRRTSFEAEGKSFQSQYWLNTMRSLQSVGGATVKEPVVCIQLVLTLVQTRTLTLQLLSGTRVELSPAIGEGKCDVIVSSIPFWIKPSGRLLMCALWFLHCVKALGFGPKVSSRVQPLVFTWSWLEVPIKHGNWCWTSVNEGQAGSCS